MVARNVQRTDHQGNVDDDERSDEQSAAEARRAPHRWLA
jgi:hypothetical protein